MTKNVSKIEENDLCIGCGTCVALCPNDAIVLVENKSKGLYYPQLYASRCTQCGFCLKVCPTANIKFEKKDTHLSLLKNGQFVCLECYSGYALEKKLRHDASSGGLVTALAVFALKSGLIKGVLVTKMGNKNPLRPEPFIAKNETELLSALGSKYCPVPINMLLKDLLKSEGKHIMVGLPCHIRGLNNAEQMDKHISEKIFLRFGLACNHTPTFHATDYLLRTLQISKNDVQSIKYRGNGWPDGISIQLKDGTKRKLMSADIKYWGYVFKRFFWPNACVLCEDKLCEFADIVFMDAWLPEYSSVRLGTSLILVRNKKSKEFLQKAIEAGVIHLDKISLEKLVRGASMNSVATMKVAQKRVSRFFPQKTITNTHFAIKPKFSDYLDAFSFLFLNKLCRSNSVISTIIVNYCVTIKQIEYSTKRLVKKIFF